MIISIILAILTACAVALHGIILYGMYHIIPQRSRLDKEVLSAYGLITVSGLLHIINFIH